MEQGTPKQTNSVLPASHASSLRDGRIAESGTSLLKHISPYPYISPFDPSVYEWPPHYLHSEMASSNHHSMTALFMVVSPAYVK